MGDFHWREESQKGQGQRLLQQFSREEGSVKGAPRSAEDCRCRNYKGSKLEERRPYQVLLAFPLLPRQERQDPPDEVLSESGQVSRYQSEDTSLDELCFISHLNL